MTNDPHKQVSVLEFKRLLIELREHRPDICVRYRAIGKMWADSFLKVIHVTDKGVLLSDHSSTRFITVADLSHVMQFELDKPFQLYQPYYHYDVVYTDEW